MQSFISVKKLRSLLLSPSRIPALALLVLSVFSFVPRSGLAQVKPESQPACRSSCGSGGGGGGGGSAPFNYALSWSEFSSDTNIHMGGISGAPTSYPGHAFSGDSYGGRQGPAATAFGNSVYVAYTSTSPNGSGYNAINNVYFGSNGNFVPATATNASVVSNVNPALVTVPGSFANLSSAQSMILAVGTGAGGGFYSGPVDLLYYTRTRWSGLPSRRQTPART